MRGYALILGVSLLAASPAFASDDAMIFHTIRGEVDAARIDGEDIFTWDGEGWIGGDVNRLWFKSEGEIEGGDTQRTEVQALWSRNVAAFWDVQAGVRVDLEPETTTYLTLGVQGLAPYQFETEAAAFLSEDGNASARLKQSFDVLFTQQLILEPYVELNAYAQDVPEQDIGAGVADAELGAQLRYEITREFAPYIDVVWERALGETASMRRAAGGDVETSSVRAGVRFWF
jgi:copper resistance protein B